MRLWLHVCLQLYMFAVAAVFVVEDVFAVADVFVVSGLKWCVCVGRHMGSYTHTGRVLLSILFAALWGYLYSVV